MSAHASVAADLKDLWVHVANFICEESTKHRTIAVGTGKTVLARAAATAAGANLFVINGPDVVSEYFGESESGLRGVFAAAKAMAPSVSNVTAVQIMCRTCKAIYY